MNSRLGALAVGGLVCIAMLAMAPRSALAKDPFDDAWEQGQDFFNTGKYDQARAQFEKASGLKPVTPGPWRYLGRIAKLQLRWADCVKASSEAIRLTPDLARSDKAPQVRADIDFCRDKLGYGKLMAPLAEGQGAIAVKSNVDSSQVSVDGIKKGATPLAPAPITAGKHVVHVDAEGYLPVDLKVVVIPTIVVDVDAQLEPDPSYKAPKKPGDEDASKDITTGWVILDVIGPHEKVVTIDGKAPTYIADGSIEATPGDHLLDVTADGFEAYQGNVRVARAQKRQVTVELRSLTGIKHNRTMGYVFLGVATAAAATGFIFTQAGAGKAEQADDWAKLEHARPIGAPIGTTVPLHTRAEIDAADKKASTYNKISLVSFSVAAVAIGVGIYYFMEARSAERADEHAGEQPHFMPGIMIGERGDVGATLTWSQEFDW